MPHMRIEYSASLDGRVGMEDFVLAIREAILSTGLFELGAIRVRAFRADHVAITDLDPANGFIHMEFRIGEGRSLADKKAAGEVIFAAATQALSPLFDTPHFALSFEIVEIVGDVSWKKNAMHARLRAAKEA